MKAKKKDLPESEPKEPIEFLREVFERIKNTKEYQEAVKKRSSEKKGSEEEEEEEIVVLRVVETEIIEPK